MRQAWYSSFNDVQPPLSGRLFFVCIRLACYAFLLTRPITGISMQKITVSLTQTICAVLVAVFATLLAFGERKHIWLLVPLATFIYMPFYAWWKTGRFTYLPTVADTKVQLETKGYERIAQRQKQFEKPVKQRNPDYDLRDIPLPPKRRVPKPTASLPYGNGHAPKKIDPLPRKDRCALLLPVDKQSVPIAKGKDLVGQTQPLFEKTAGKIDAEPEEIFVTHDGIFL